MDKGIDPRFRAHNTHLESPQIFSKLDPHLRFLKNLPLVHRSYYIKGEGEIDIAYIHDREFWPIEIKWTGQMRPKDLKQVSKYKNALICTRSDASGEINGVRTEPLPLNLLRLGTSPVTNRR